MKIEKINFLFTEVEAFGNNLNKLMIAKDLNQIITRNFENHADIGEKIL